MLNKALVKIVLLSCFSIGFSQAAFASLGKLIINCSRCYIEEDPGTQYSFYQTECTMRVSSEDGHTWKFPTRVKSRTRFRSSNEYSREHASVHCIFAQRQTENLNGRMYSIPEGGPDQSIQIQLLDLSTNGQRCNCLWEGGELGYTCERLVDVNVLGDDWRDWQRIGEPPETTKIGGVCRDWRHQDCRVWGFTRNIENACSDSDSVLRIFSSRPLELE